MFLKKINEFLKQIEDLESNAHRRWSEGFSKIAFPDSTTGHNRDKHLMHCFDAVALHSSAMERLRLLRGEIDTAIAEAEFTQAGQQMMQEVKAGTCEHCGEKYERISSVFGHCLNCVREILEEDKP